MDTTQRIQTLQRTLAERRDARVRAETARDTAAEALEDILTRTGSATVADLKAKAAEAQKAADAALEAAEAALSA